MKGFRGLSLVIVAVLCVAGVENVQGASLDTVFVSSVQADPGVNGVHVPVYARVGPVGGEDLDGVNFGLSYNQSVLVCDTIIYEVADPNYPSFYDLIPSPFMFTPRCYPDSGWATTGIIFSMIGDKDIPPGYYRMFDIVLNVQPGAAPGDYPLHIDDEAGTPHIGNYFTHNITVEYFEKVDGLFTVKGAALGAISGIVINQEDSQPIEGAYVRADSYSDYTNEDGEYLISGLPAGTYDVIASAIGFESDTVEDVEVTVGHTAIVNFELTPSECVNTLFSGSGVGVGGDTIRIPVTAMNCSELDGYTVSLAYPNQFLKAIAIDTTGTATGGVSPDSFRYKLTFGGDVLPGFVLVQCMISLDHSRTIPIGTNKLFDILFEVRPNPPDTVSFEFRTYPEAPWPGSGPIENEFIFGDFHFTPNLENGYFIMLPSFVRGDVDGDAYVRVNDALMILLNLFHVSGAPPLTCLDAADYNDDGLILTDDALSLLLWIFGVEGSVPPPPPYPNCGADPTSFDSLLCSWHESCMSEPSGLPLTFQLDAEAENSVTVGKASIDEDGVAIVPVILHAQREISGFQLECSFDDDIFTLRSVERTDLVNSFDFFSSLIEDENGKVMIGGIPDFQMERLLPPGTYQLANLVFSKRTLDSVPEPSPLQLGYVGVYDSRAEALPVQAKDGAIIGGGGQFILPTDFKLGQNYPNPFNKRTRIDFIVPYGSDVRIDVFDICGEKICTLLDVEKTTMQKLQVFWDGKDESKKEVSSGIYFYRLTCGRRKLVKKMVFLK